MLLDEEYWRSVVRPVDNGMVVEKDLDLYTFADAAEDIWSELIETGLTAHGARLPSHEKSGGLTWKRQKPRPRPSKRQRPG